MSVIRIDPFRGFDAIACKVNSFVNGFENGVVVELGNLSPKIDIKEDDNHIYINAELSGIKKEDVSISINDENILHIKAIKLKPEQNEALKFHKIERNFGEFTRSFNLPLNVDKESIKAKFENGVLYLTLVKILPKKPKDVEITIN
jgi:HSP20 family protein